jgi:hypothetical protein
MHQFCKLESRVRFPSEAPISLTYVIVGNMKNKTKIMGGSQYSVSGRSHYQRNRAKYLAKAREARQQKKLYILEVKKKGKCVDCGNTDYRVLDFDHLPGNQKDDNVSVMWARNLSIKRIQQEIDKCELVCANCHRIRTHQRAAVLLMVAS